MRIELFFSLLVQIVTMSPAAFGAAALSQSKLLLSFQGKGSSLAYDAGVVSHVYQKSSALKNHEVVLSANSSGAILSIYFACHGFNDQSVANLNKIFLEGTPRIKESLKYLREEAEDPLKKKTVILKDKKIPGIAISTLDPYIEAALGISSITQLNAATCKAKVPFVIVASNLEVLNSMSLPNFSIAFETPSLDRLLNGDNPFRIASLEEKEFDIDTFDVSWKPKVHKQYLTMIATEAGRTKFAYNHKNLTVGTTRRIGKACTYFVSQDMFDLLRKLPQNERQCDLRLADDPAGMALAIRASVAEPTYFYDVDEPEPHKLLVEGDTMGQLGNSLKRSYWGGFIMPMVAQDIRRLLPSIHVLGSGWTVLEEDVAGFLSRFVLVNSIALSHYTEYWSDMSIRPTKALSEAISNRTMTTEAEYQEGRRRTAQCLSDWDRVKDICLPEVIDAPLLLGASEHAMVTPGYTVPEELETQRGLIGLLDLKN